MQRQASPRLSPRFEAWIGLFAALYAALSIAVALALPRLDLENATREALNAAAPFLLAFEAVALAVLGGLIVTWLRWYSALIDWARGRGVRVPGNAAAVLYSLMPLVNLVHPLRTLREVQRATAVASPVGWWWALAWLWVAMSPLEASWILYVGHETAFAVLTVMIEVTSLLLCWRVVRDFRLADQAWDPAGALATRDAQNESTSAAPS